MKILISAIDTLCGRLYPQHFLFIHSMNHPSLMLAFSSPLVDLLGSTDNEEIQCHAISTLRNLAASSDKNKQLVLEAGAVQKM